MIVRELIAELEELIQRHEKGRYYEGEDYLGEATIHIDVFEEDAPNSSFYEYKGASDKIKIEVSRDGVLNILSGFAQSYPKEVTK